MAGTGVFPTVAPNSGASPLTTNFTTSFANTDLDAIADVDNYSWVGVDSAPVGAECMTTGAETYVIAGGAVTQLTGISAIDGVTVAVNSPVLIATAPAASGAGTAISAGAGSSEPANGLYYVSSLSGGNIALTRTATMSANSPQTNPAGRVVFVRGGTVNGITMWTVSNPAGHATFTYGTTAMQWTNYQYTLNSPLIKTPTIQSPVFTGTGVPNAAIQQAAINNFNHALQSQVTVAGTPYYVTNSGLAMPASPLTGMVANKTAFVWNIMLTKNAAGTGTFQIVLYRGTNGSTSDTADVTQTLGTQTAVIDEMVLNIQLVVTTTGSSGGYYWTIIPDNRASVPATPAGFGVPGTGSDAYFNGSVSSVAMNTAGLVFGIGFIANTGGTLPTVTVPLCQAFAYNMN